MNLSKFATGDILAKVSVHQFYCINKHLFSENLPIYKKMCLSQKKSKY